MSQPHSNNFANNAYPGSYSNAQQQESHLAMPRTQPHPAPRNRFPNLPADVRLPPSLNHSQDYGNRPHVPPRSIQPAPSSNYPAHNNTAPITSAGDKSSANQSLSVEDFSRILEGTERENSQLKDAIGENNLILSSKLSDLEKQSRELIALKEENAALRDRFSSSTNQFFEARVAVLGFKCRVMQLQAQSNSSIKQSTTPQPPLGPHEVNAQISTLRQERIHLMNENKSLEAVVLAERDKLTKVQDKKKIAEEETQQLQAKVAQLENDARLMEDRLGQAQNHSYQEHSTRSHISQQLRTTETDNKRLQSQLDAANLRETTLQGQVQGLKAKEKELCERIHQLETRSSGQPPPVPKPRTSVVSPQLTPQQQLEIERLEAERVALREKIGKERESRLTVEESLRRKSVEYQELVLKYNTEKSENTSLKQQQQGDQSGDAVERLTTELAQLRMSETSAVQNLRHKDSQMQRLLAEKNDLQAKVASLEKQRTEELATLRKEKRDEVATLRRAKDECDGKIANLEERLRLATATQTAVGAKGGVSSSAMARRLNDALGKVKEVQTKLDNQNRDFESDRETWEREKELLQREVTRLNEEGGDKLGHIEESLSYYDGEVKRLEEREATLSEEKIALQLSLDRARQEVSLKNDSHRQLSQQLSQLQTEVVEKSQTLSELHGRLSDVNKEKEMKATKLQHLATDFTDLKDKRKQWEQEKKHLVSENRQLAQQLAATQNSMGQEKQSLEGIIVELQAELVKADQEQGSYASRLRTVEAQLEQMSMSHQQLSAEMDEKRARLKQVEGQRNGVQDRLKHMDAQLKIYQEDFERERQAREAAVKVRNMVEERIAKKEKEVKELRERLNQQAMTTLSAEDQYDEPPDSHTGGSYRALSRRHNAPPPDAHSISPSPTSGRSVEHLNQTHGDFQPPPQDQSRSLAYRPLSGEHQRRSQEQQHFSGPQHQEAAPPVPPRVPISHGGYPPQGHQGGFQGNPHGGQFGGHHDQTWTQQLPVTSAPQQRVRPMTTAQEPATAGGGVLAGLHPPQGYQQGSHLPQPGSDSGWRPPAEMRRNDLSMGPVSSSGSRNNLSAGPQQQGRNNLDMAPAQTRPPPPASQQQLQSMAPQAALPFPVPPPPGSQQLQFVQGEWVGPGEVMNQAPPSMACPICGQQNFHTQTDLELHCARCT